MEIGGCKYNFSASIPAENIYWLKDNTTIIDVPITSQKLSLTSLVFENANFEEQGTYQCVINISSMFKATSQPVNVNFIGTHYKYYYLFLIRERVCSCESNQTVSVAL